ncbi:MAG: four-carbon acid sugar kinase family protein [Pirellulales bacterium]
MTRIATDIAAAGPTWVYKNATRYYAVIRHRKQAIARAARLSKDAVDPANPTRGRVIRDGCLWIHEKPPHETLFAHDPDYPRLTSRVAELLPDA